MAVKGKLIEQVEQLSVRVTKLKGEVVNGKECVAELHIKLRADEKRAKDITYEHYSLQARLHQSQSGRDKVGESITCVQDTISRFSAGLMKNQ